MDRDVFALMALVGLLPILVDPRENHPNRGKTLQTPGVSQSPKNTQRTQPVFSVYLVLLKLNIPPSGGMSHVVAKRVFELVMSTGNRHVDEVFDMYREVSVKNVERF